MGDLITRQHTEFYIRERKIFDIQGDMALFRGEFINVEQAAYKETEEEYDTTCKQITAGRCVFCTHGINETSTLISP